MSVVIYLSIRHKELWRPPGNFLLMVSLSELMLSAHWFSTTIYYLTYDEPLKSDDLFCQFQSFFGIFAGALEILYNCAFYLYIIITLKRSLLKGQNSSTMNYHIIIIFLASLVVFIAYIYNNTGKTLYATCSIRVILYIKKKEKKRKLFFNYNGFDIINSLFNVRIYML